MIELFIVLIPALPLAGFLFAVLLGPRLDRVPVHGHDDHATDAHADSDAHGSADAHGAIRDKGQVSEQIGRAALQPVGQLVGRRGLVAAKDRLGRFLK